MSFTSYATRDDVFNLGLSAQAFVARARPVVAADVEIATGTIRMKGHGFSAADLISFEVTSGGALPVALAAFGFAHATPLPTGFDFFRVASVLGGSSPIASFASAGSGWAVAIDVQRRLDMNLRAAAARINEKLTAHSPPLLVDPITLVYPPIIVWVNAILAALSTVTTLQFENADARRAVDQLVAMKTEADKDLEVWLAGKPVQPRPTDGTDVPDNAARAEASRPAVPWSTGAL